MFLGQRAYGVGAAAEVYFGKTSDQLTLPEIRADCRHIPSALARQSRRECASLARSVGAATCCGACAKRTSSPSRKRRHCGLNAPVQSQAARSRIGDRSAVHCRDGARRSVQPARYRRIHRRIRSDHHRGQPAAGERGACVRAALFEYDQRHGYRGPAGTRHARRELSREGWAQAIDEYPHRGGVAPAVVLSVGEKSAVAFSPTHGRLNLGRSGSQLGARPASRRRSRSGAATRG